MSLSRLLWAAASVCLTLLPYTNAQSHTRFTNQTSNYSKFELFKNTGLLPCPINMTRPSKSMWDTDRFIEEASLDSRTKTGYCKYMNGIPIMIPTTPTQAAFFPWWPTFLTQFVSLLFTFVGLWWTSRSLRKHKDQPDMKLPITFWVQVPVDILREIAWFVKSIHGFATPKRFPWAR